MELKNFKIAEAEATTNDINIDIDILENSKDNRGKAFEIIKRFLSFAKAPLLVILATTFLIVWAACQQPKELTMKCALVSEQGSTSPAFLGYEFTPELIDSIKSGDIDLYGVFIVKDGDFEISFEDSKTYNTGAAERLQVVKAEYIEYTEEYMEKYFSPDYVEKLKAEEDNPGYWNYTIDLKD